MLRYAYRNKIGMKAENTKNSSFKSPLFYNSRFAELSIGLIASRLTVWIFDYFFYPFVIYNFGFFRGGAIMTFLSFVACILIMKFYDWSKRDWIGIEAIKEIKTYKGTKKIGHVTAWVLKKSKPIVFFFLSVKFDPFVTTAFMRQGKYNGMSKRDWSIFAGSLILGNAYWTLACYMGITLVEWGQQAVAG